MILIAYIKYTYIYTTVYIQYNVWVTTTWNQMGFIQHKATGPMIANQSGVAGPFTYRYTGKGLVALVHSTSSMPTRSQGEVSILVVFVSKLGLPKPLSQIISAVPRLPCTRGMEQWNLLQIRCCQMLRFMKGLQHE